MTTSRRDFLKTSTAAVAAGVATDARGAEGGGAKPDNEQKAGEQAPAAIPPHRPLHLSGVHGYAEKAVRPGETLHFRISSPVAYELAVCRLGEVDRRKTDVVLWAGKQAAPREQPIHPGSYLHVVRNLPDAELRAFSLELWVCPWRLNAPQALVSQFDAQAACGFALSISDRGALEFYLGDGGAYRREWLDTRPRLALDRWQHVVAIWDGQQKSLWIDGRLAASWQRDLQPRAGAAPLRLGARGRDGAACDFLDGDLAAVAIYERALDAPEITTRFAARGLTVPQRRGLLASWQFSEERGASVADDSPHARHAEIVNHGTWMIGGPSFQGDFVDRYADYDPQIDKHRGHGLRLAGDDLYDCRWSVTDEYALPADAPQGVYAGRVRYEEGGQPRDYYITFVVRKAERTAKAPLLVLCSTNTWLAYGATPFAGAEHLAAGSGRVSWGTFGLTNPSRAPAYSCYRDHEAGQPPCQFGMEMPWPVAGPEVVYGPPEVGYSHLARGERFTHAWLEQAGYTFDLATDQDLDSQSGLLDGYKAVVINGHSEYWSTRAYKAVEQYLKRGGNLVVLSGNTMFWRVSYSDCGRVMECRKYDRDVGASRRARLGEIWHSHDARRGGLMREAGMAAWRLIGLETIGWWALADDDFGSYRAASVDHFLWHKPREVGVAAGESFGEGIGGALPRAVGHEGDVRLSTIAKLSKFPPPAGMAQPEDPPGLVTLARGIRKPPATSTSFDYFLRHGGDPEAWCEMIYWERPDGGRVFHAGAIAAGWALSADTRFQTLVANVLDHYGVQPRT